LLFNFRGFENVTKNDSHSRTNKIMKNPPGKKVLLPDDSPAGELRRVSARRTVVLAALLAGILALNSGTASLLPRLCLWYHLTGTDCPFCGLSRSVVATGDLNFARAVSLHPLGPVVLVLLALWLIVSILRWKTGRPGAIPGYVQKKIWIVAGAGWLAWWVVARLLVQI
jgi:hypothetical protein